MPCFLAKYLANRGELFGNVRIGETIISAKDPHCDSLPIGSTEALAVIVFVPFNSRALQQVHLSGNNYLL
jgi:hypothetical protein